MKNHLSLFAIVTLLIIWTAAGRPLAAQTQEEEEIDCECLFTFDSTFEETGGPKYRKIALNGMPLTDEKPQYTEETDEDREETYIDALNHTLSHSVTDIYIPLGGTDLALTVRRNATPESWNKWGSGPTPYYADELDRPDRPFGYGWTSNLGASLEYIYRFPAIIEPDPESACPVAGVRPDEVVVTDENGEQSRFLILYDGTEESFLPTPTGHHQVEAYVNTLRYENGGFTFTKKFGTTLRFEMTNVVRTFANRYALTQDPAAAVLDEIRQYGRLSSVTARDGTQLSYNYNGDGLIPATISARGKTITITSSNDRVTSIEDPRGKVWHYEYKSMPNFENTNSVLEKVTSPKLEVTKYDYEVGVEEDFAPLTLAEPYHEVNEYYHLELTKITDPQSKEWKFFYAFDHSKLNGIVGPNAEGNDDGLDIQGYYVANGSPRNVYKVVTPVSTAYFFNLSQIKVEWGLDPDPNTGELFGVVPDVDIIRYMKVTDGEGEQRSYYFLDNDITITDQVGGFFYRELPKRRYPWNIRYGKMELYHATGQKETFTFNVNAGMQVASIVDLSGNTTSFQYDDVLDAQIRFPFLPSTFSLGYFGDPTSQTNALGKTRTFKYTSKYRLMKEMVDELGRKTEWGFDNNGNRISESVYDPGDQLVMESEFQYNDPNFPGFMTRKIVRKLSGAGDPDWVENLVVHYVPDAAGNIFREIVDPQGLALTTTYLYDENNNRTSVTDPREYETTFEYDDVNRLVKVTYPDTTFRQIGYYPGGRKEWDRNERGHYTRYEYDGARRLTKATIEMESPVPDIVTQFSYNSVGSKETFTDARGKVTKYHYDSMQRLEELEDPNGEITKYSYMGNSGASSFDTSGFKPTKITDPRGWVTDIIYDELYRETEKRIEYKAGTPKAITKRFYDYVGNLTKVRDPLNKETDTDYDHLNRPIKVTYADDTFTQTAYTSTGLAWRTIDERGNPTKTRYDTAGRAVKLISPEVDRGDGTLETPITENVYDDAGNIEATINPLGRRWDYVFDSRNRKTKEILPAVNGERAELEYEYDAVGNLKKLTDAKDYFTDYHYDAANRQVKVELPNVPGLGRPTTETKYDPNGNILEIKDPENNLTTNTYDDLNRLETTTDAEGIVVKNEYDEVGNRTAVIDGKLQRTEFEYDGLNRNTKIIDAANEATAFEYDAVNNTARVDAEGHRTEYQYDDRHRLEHNLYIGRSQDNRDYEYDDSGNLLSVTVPDISGTPAGVRNVSYAYDALNRQTSETSAGKTHTYKYDLANNRTYALYGGSTVPLISAYDALNRLDTLTEGSRVTDYEYDLNGNVLEKTLPNGDVVVSTYDPLNRRTTITGTNVSSSPLYSYVTTYDQVGNVKTITETYGNTSLNRSVTNTYDDIYRLTQENIVKGTKSVARIYAYDDANNRENYTAYYTSDGFTLLASDNVDFAYNNLNQLTGYTGNLLNVSAYGHEQLEFTLPASFVYDDDGNRIQRSRSGVVTGSYQYDYENYLVYYDGDMTAPITYSKFTYLYDYRGRRVFWVSEDGDEVVKTSFSGGVSAQEYSASDVLTVTNIRGSDWGGGVGGMLYTLRSTAPSYTHSNGRGDIVAKTNAAGAITYQSQYEAFGRRLAETGSTLDRQKANTKDEDPTGLLNEGFRYRDLETGTFITRDPAGFIDGPNLYAYVRQNPWTKFDPHGLKEFGPSGSQVRDMVRPATPVVVRAAATSGPAAAVVVGAVGYGGAAGAVGIVGINRAANLATYGNPYGKPSTPIVGLSGEPGVGSPAGADEEDVQTYIRERNAGSPAALANLNNAGNVEDAPSDSDGKPKKDGEKPTKPRRKSKAALVREYLAAHPDETWPVDEDGADFQAHHVDPLADGGDDDGGTNIKPLAKKDHRKLHKDRGDFKRWGARAKKEPGSSSSSGGGKPSSGGGSDGDTSSSGGPSESPASGGGGGGGGGGGASGGPPSDDS